MSPDAWLESPRTSKIEGFVAIFSELLMQSSPSYIFSGVGPGCASDKNVAKLLTLFMWS